MSFIGDILQGAGATSDFEAKQAQIDKPTTVEQVTDQYGNAVNALQGQQALNTNIQGMNGVQNLQAAYQAMQNTANGIGPNPAMAQLNQATGANTANQAALMAGQRGVGANPALLARLAAQQGGANQQAAVGQGATMQAQQSAQAQQNMANIANQQLQSQLQSSGLTNQSAQGLYGQVSGNVMNQNNQAIQNAAQANGVNAQTANSNAQTTGKLLGGALGGAGSAAAMFANGGMVQAPGGRSKAAMHFSATPTVAMSNGGPVPGAPVMGGDHPANDVVPAMLSPGEVVIPKSIMESKNPAEQAKKFVAALLAKKGM